MTRLQFIIFDENRPRAAAISAALNRQRGVVVRDSLPVQPDATTAPHVALVADEPGVIRSVLERLKLAGLRAKVIAYNEEPTPHAMVKAMSAGAADYLHWPCDPGEIIAAATAATARATS